MRLWTIALKNLRRRKLRSCTTALGLGLAVATLVALHGLAASFERSFTHLFKTRGIDVLVAPVGSNQRPGSVMDERLADRLRGLPGVKAVEPALVDVTSLGGQHILGVPLVGWRAESPLMHDLQFVEGRPLRADEPHTLLLGKNLAAQLGKKADDALDLEGQTFRVVGVFDSPNVLEISGAILLLGELQELIDRRGKVSGFAVFVDRGAGVDLAALCAAIEGMRDANGRPLQLEAQTTESYVSQRMEFRMARGMAWMTSTLALVLSSIGVLNTMMMSVFERTAEIGILRAIGWQRSRVVRLILSEALLLSVAGSVFGCGLALLLVQCMSYLPQTALLVEGTLPPVVMFEGVVMGLLVGTAGTLYPALRAARLTPLEATRHA